MLLTSSPDLMSRARNVTVSRVIVLSIDSAGLYRSRVVQKRKALISVYNKVRRIVDFWHFEFNNSEGKKLFFDAGKEQGSCAEAPLMERTHAGDRGLVLTS